MPTLVLYEKAARKKHYRKNERVIIKKAVIHGATSLEVARRCGLELVFTKPKLFGHKAVNLIGPLTLALSVLRSPNTWEDSHLIQQLAFTTTVAVQELLTACRENPNASIRVEDKYEYRPGEVIFSTPPQFKFKVT